LQIAILTGIRVHKLRYSLKFALAVHTGEHTAALGQDHAIATPCQFIRMLDPTGRDARAGRFQLQLLIVQRGPVVLDLQPGYDKKHAGRLKITIGYTVGAQKLRASHLKPHGMDAVVDDAGLVRLGVPGYNGYRMSVNRYALRKSHNPKNSKSEIRNKFKNQMSKIQNFVADAINA